MQANSNPEKNNQNKKSNHWFIEHIWCPLIIGIIVSVIGGVGASCIINPQSIDEILSNLHKLVTVSVVDEETPLPTNNMRDNEKESDDMGIVGSNKEPESDENEGNISFADAESNSIYTPVSGEISNAPKYRVTYDASNYFGNIELSSDFACAGESVTITVDVCQFYSMNINDEYGNPIEIYTPPINSGNTIPFSFVMPACNVVISINTESELN